MYEIKEINMKNGLRICTIQMPGTRSVSISILFCVGSRDDGIMWPPGTAHFAEHATFLSAENKSSLDGFSSIEQIGGFLDASTDKDFTIFATKVPSRHQVKAAKILSNIVLHSSPNEKQINQEATVIREEILTDTDNPEILAQMLAEQLMFPNNSLGTYAGGLPDSIRKIDLNTINSFRDQYYRPNNALIVLAGDVNDDVKAELNNIWHNIKPKTLPNRFLLPANSQHRNFGWKNKTTDQLYMCFGLETISRNSNQVTSTELINTILGSTMSSILWQELRAKNSLAYSVASETQYFDETGILTIHVNSAEENSSDVISIILKQIEQAAKGKNINKENVEAAKEFYVGNFELALENSYVLATWLGQWIFNHKTDGFSIDYFLDRIRDKATNFL